MKQIKILFMLVMTVLMMGSCLSESDSSVTLYNDAAITDFTLGTLNTIRSTLTSRVMAFITLRTLQL